MLVKLTLPEKLRLLTGDETLKVKVANQQKCAYQFSCDLHMLSNTWASVLFAFQRETRY